MATAKDQRPIQVFLDARRFIELPEPVPFGGGSKDFFQGDNRGFAEHKKRITANVQNVARIIRRGPTPAGFVRVRQKEVALAKSHRPMGALFTHANQFAFVGADRVGELIFQATPTALERLAHIIDQKAELKPRIVENRRTGEREPRVTAYRSELGGISDIQLYAAPDKLTFSAEEAVAWMRQPNVIGGYVVELFRPDRDLSPNAVDQMVAALRTTLDRVKGGLLVRPFLPSTRVAQFGDPSLLITVQLTAENQRLIELPFGDDGRSALISESSFPVEMKGYRPEFSARRHGELLSLLSEAVLVRSIDLPPILETTPSMSGTTLGVATIPEPKVNVDYPTVGVIDGGVGGKTLEKWKVGEAGLVPASHRDEVHGTFIAGLVAAGSALNAPLSESLEPSGCKFYDLDLFPRRDLRSRYYPDLEDLFDALDEKVKVAKRDHGVRVFNLSFSIRSASSRLAYSPAADRLDRIARAHDVVFVVAAGNIANTRPPWPAKAEDVAVMLAGLGFGDQQITPPAEHILGITVGALNPVGVSGHIARMPTTYTRRGPGVGGARKPELAHYGGAGTSASGLVSVRPNGHAAHDCGTSFAAPLTAATLATLDQRLARQAPRETLMALPVHRASRPTALDKPALRHIAREFVGFGMSPPADVSLSDSPHAVTLVFNERLLNKQRLEFPFAWPKSLIGKGGACRGRADVTLSYTPPIDPDHREEAIRVQLEAHLHQEKVDEESGEITWESRLNHDAGDIPQGMSKTESYLVRTGLKWSPLKRYRVTMPTGRGASSNWKLSLESLGRAGSLFPADGVAFCLVLTISDPADAAPVREEMRLDLQNRGLQLADITVAHRVRSRRS